MAGRPPGGAHLRDAHYPIGWFSTGRDAAARELLTAVWRAIARGGVRAKLSFVFSDRERGEAPESDRFLELVESYGIPLVSFSSRKFLPQMRNAWLREGLFSETLRRWRLLYDQEVMARLASFRPELCVLAGYMLIVGPEMCRKLTMVNLHPALPGGPAGTWQEVIWQLLEKDASETGVMMHLVTEELDAGPPVTYCRFPIRGSFFDDFSREVEGRTVGEIRWAEGEGNALFRLIRKYGVAREIPLIVATIAAFAEGRVWIEDGKVMGAEGEVMGGYDLSEEIERTLAGGRKP